MDSEIYAQTISDIGRAIDAVGVAAITISAIVQLTRDLRAFARHDGDAAYRGIRVGVGRGVLLGLEILFAGDIIRTVAASPTLASVAILASIVGIRSFLSFTIGVEAEGRWPWSRRGPAAIPDIASGRS
jgi:uncharacterized membrane protein